MVPHHPLITPRALPPLVDDVQVVLFDPATFARAGEHGWLATLDAEERARAARFARTADRERFVVCRAILRELLAHHAGATAHAIRFRFGPAGKPALGAAHGDLTFNLSHTGDRALVALARDRPLGVDVERIRDLDDLERLAARFFTPAETDAVLRVHGRARTAAFFRCWTRKEAFLKGTGLGITAPLDGFEVGVEPGAPGAPVRLVTNAFDPERGGDWRLLDLEAGPDHAAALAVRGVASAIHCYELAPTDRADGK